MEIFGTGKGRGDAQRSGKDRCRMSEIRGQRKIDVRNQMSEGLAIDDFNSHVVFNRF